MFLESGYDIATMHTLQYVQTCIEKISRIAVPLFFAISGYLFFWNVTTIDEIREKIKKRANTLLIPFVIGCLFTPLFFYIISNLPYISNLLKSSLLSELSQMSICELFYAIFITPTNVPLWYIRDLMIIVVTTPLLYYIRRWGLWVCIVLFFCWIFLSTDFTPDDGMVMSHTIYKSYFWFMAGSFFIDKKYPLWVSLLLFTVYATSCIMHEQASCIFRSINGLYELILTFGVLGFWNTLGAFISDGFSIKQHKYLNYLSAASFFVYIYHFSTIGIVRK